jgi:hypothetical protein
LLRLKAAQLLQQGQVGPGRNDLAAAIRAQLGPGL